MWQDYVLTAIQIVFCITLIPMLRAPEKPPLSSSLMTGIVLLVSAFTVATLGLWLAAISQSVVGVQWLTLAYQRVRGKTNSETLPTPQ